MDLSNWMSELDEYFINVPLIHLAIPGKIDFAFSYKFGLNLLNIFYNDRKYCISSNSDWAKSLSGLLITNR